MSNFNSIIFSGENVSELRRCKLMEVTIHMWSCFKKQIQSHNEEVLESYQSVNESSRDSSWLIGHTESTIPGIEAAYGGRELYSLHYTEDM